MYEEAAETMPLQRRQREVWNYLSDVSLLNTDDLSEMCFCDIESDKDSKYLSVHQDHLRSLLKMQVLGPPSRFRASMGPRTCILPACLEILMPI